MLKHFFIALVLFGFFQWISNSNPQSQIDSLEQQNEESEDQCSEDELQVGISSQTDFENEENLPALLNKYILVEKIRNIPQGERRLFLPFPKHDAIDFEDHSRSVIPYRAPDSTTREDISEYDPNSKYQKFRRFAQGHFGEVWLATTFGSDVPRDMFDAKYVLKRMFNKSQKEYRLSGLREVYFGELFQGQPYIGRFVETFELDEDLWLVFYNEGASLTDMLYEKSEGGLVHSSQKWKWMRTTENGKALMKHILKSVLMGLDIVHAFNVTHRDLKPSNILVHRTDGALRIIDFGSSVDDYSIDNLYDPPPSQAEETLDYAPPEVLFSDEPYSSEYPQSYDIWSVGVLFLEMVLGTSVVFEIDGRTKAILEKKMARKSKAYKQRAYFFQALGEYCFYSQYRECTEVDTMKAISRRDPLKMEFQDRWAALLMRRFMEYNPAVRISAHTALTHAFFVGAHTCPVCGMEFEFDFLMKEHLQEEHSVAPFFVNNTLQYLAPPDHDS